MLNENQQSMQYAENEEKSSEDDVIKIDFKTFVLCVSESGCSGGKKVCGRAKLTSEIGTKKEEKEKI
jgi:hypothetical protein